MRGQSNSRRSALHRPLEDAHVADVRIELLAHPLQAGALGYPLGSDVAGRNRRPDPLYPRLRHAMRAEREHRFRRVAAALVLRPDRVAEKEGAVAHGGGAPRTHGFPRVPQDEEPRTGRAAAGKRIADSWQVGVEERRRVDGDRKSTRLNSSHLVISYAVFCLKKKKLTTRY